jgi:hypothetical protein
MSASPPNSLEVRVATRRRSCNGCGGGTLATENRASISAVAPTMLQACWCSFWILLLFHNISTDCWRLYFVGTLLVDRIPKSNVDCRLCRASLLWGFLLSKGVGWWYVVSG